MVPGARFDDLQRQDDERGACSECRGKESRSDDGAVPEWACAKTRVEESRDGVDTDRPSNCDKDERDIELLGWCAFVVGAPDEVAGDPDIEQ